MLVLTGLLLFLASLFSTTQAATVGNAIVLHRCPYPVYCSPLRGYAKDDPTPPELRDKPNFKLLPPRTPIALPFNIRGMIPMTIMCTRDPNANDKNPLVTQLEWKYESPSSVGGPDRIWIDASLVAGRPFINEGLQLNMKAETFAINGGDNGFWKDSCRRANCPAGQWNCGGIYNFDNDDHVSSSCCW
jgi:hypothetical protein